MSAVLPVMGVVRVVLDAGDGGGRYEGGAQDSGRDDRDCQPESAAATAVRVAGLVLE